MGSLFLVTEIHRQAILHSYDIYGSFEQCKALIILMVVSWSVEFTYVNPQVYKTKPLFIDSVFTNAVELLNPYSFSTNIKCMS